MNQPVTNEICRDAGGFRDVPIVQKLIVKARIVRDGMTQAAATRRTMRRQR